MNKLKPVVIIFVMAFFITALPAFADQTGHGSMGTDHHPVMENKTMKDMDHSGSTGELIHESKVDGYTFSYHLIYVKEKIAKMKNMPGMEEMKDITHHMMVYIVGPDKSPVKSAKVGYFIIGPDGKKQKRMCMGMGDGFGADISLINKGVYKMSAKAIIGHKKLKDSFSYEVK